MPNPNYENMFGELPPPPGGLHPGGEYLPDLVQPPPAQQQGTTNEFVFPTGEEVQPYSGLPPEYRDQLLGFLMPQLQQGVENYEGNIDQYTQSALGTYRQEFDRYIKDEIPKQIGNLAKRGVLNSSVAENALGRTYSDAATASSGRGYQTAMEAAKLKAQAPQTLGQLLGYGQYSADPTVMYSLLARLIAGEQP
jgi:hypothetical protein